MPNHRQSDLEARVARLERLLNRVLELVQELQAERTGPPEPLPDELMEEMGAMPPVEVEAEAEGPDFPDGASPPPSSEAPGEAPWEVAEPAPPSPWEVPDWDRGAEKGRAADPWPAKEPMDWQAFFAPGGPFLSRLGITLLVFSVIFFFKYSIDQGWLTPAIRLGIGLLAGMSLAGMGFRGASKGEYLGTALAGGGIATFFITGYAAHQWYSLVPYWMAFGLLLGASALGVFLSLKARQQTLAMVGLIGALATPLILSAETARLGVLVFYVCLIVAAVSAIYMALAWRALFLMAVATTLPVLGMAVGQATGPGVASRAAVQAGIIFSGLVFWVVPVLRALLRARDPHRWPRPTVPSAKADDSGPGWGDGSLRSDLQRIPWNAHLDALSLLMPGIAILLSAWLWDLTGSQLGTVLLGTSLLAQAMAWGIGQMDDPEESASTQSFVAILLATVGMGLVLSGDVLYLALIAEAAVLFAVAARKDSSVLMVLGGAVEVVVLGIFVSRLLLFGDPVHEGSLYSLYDLVAIGAAVFIGTQLKASETRGAFFAAAYLGFLAFTAREFQGHWGLLYLVFIIEAAVTQLVARRYESDLLEKLGHIPAVMGLALFSGRLENGGTLLSGDLASLADLTAVGGLAYIGTLLKNRDFHLGYLFTAYACLLAWTARELLPLDQGQALLSLAIGVEGTAVLVAGYLSKRPLLQMTGMGTLLLVVGKVLVVDLAAVEPIWRVLLFSLFGGLFLILSKVLGPGAGESPEKEQKEKEEEEDEE